MQTLKKIWAWVVANFTWSNEDFLFITAALTTLQQIHWDPNNTLFALSLGSGLKGALSMFKIIPSVPQLEDICLFVGGLVTLIQIHFLVLNPETHQLNPMFVLTIGAMGKAAFGFFGVPWPFMGAQPVPVQPMAPAVTSSLVQRVQAKPVDAVPERPVLNPPPADNPIVERGEGFVKLKDGTILRVDPPKK